MKFVGLNLHKHFRQKEIVRGVSFSVSVGEVVGLLGPNGAGKTTCFLLMAGLIKPNEGKILLNNQDITFWPLYRKARLGLRYLPQDASIFRGMTVEDNLMTVLELLEPDPNRRRDQLEALLVDFNLVPLRKSSALILSGGERRRVEIARALVGHPCFLLLDEPLAGIDPKSISEMRDMILHLKERNIGVIISDHNVRDTLALVDRAYIMHAGRILAEGTPQELAENKGVRDIYLGHSFSL